MSGRKLNFRKSTRLSVRLTLTYAVVFSIMLLILSVAVIWGTNYFLTLNATDNLTQTLDAIAERVLDEYYEEGHIDGPEALQGYDSDPALIIMLLDASDARITVYRNFDMPDSVWQQAGEAAKRVSAYGVGAIVQKHAVYDGKTHIASIQIARSLSNEQGFLGIMTRLLVILDIVGFALSLLAGYIISRRMLQPIATMTQTARRISMSALDERLVASGADDELTGLAHTFNSMLDRLQTAFELQGRFVSDASHELRTPLMVMQGYIDMLDRWGKEDAAVLQEAIDAISHEAVDMSALIEKLLFLARGDAGRQMPDRTAFNLGELVQELQKEYVLLPGEHMLAFQCPEGLTITADHAMVKQMLRAILDNAVKYTPDGGMIRLDCISENGWLYITVADSGRGIQEKDIPRIFDRFYRVDASRGKATGGSGLGLSIAQWITKSHGGTIKVESELSKGTKVKITLPME